MRNKRLQSVCVQVGKKVFSSLVAAVMFLSVCPVEALADSAAVPYSAHVEPSEAPELVKLNVFDYWLENSSADEEKNRNAADHTAYNSFALPAGLPGGGGAYVGINGIHAADSQTGDRDYTHILHFRTGTATAGPEADYTRLAPNFGLVDNKLGADGYPVALRQFVADAQDSTKDAHPYRTVMPASESLAYLFDPNVSHQGKESWANVGGLFQVDQEGYYYYNSMLESTKLTANETGYDAFYGGAYETANYAWLDESDTDKPRFVLYDTWAVTHDFGKTTDGRSGYMHGQFFPFNSAEQVFQEKNGQLDGSWLACNAENGENAPANTQLNHFLGLSLEVPFMQTVDGMSRKDPDEPTTFYFSGDDDMFLFIDGVLVGDLGGIHDALTLKIDFSTGKVYINEHYPESVPQDKREMTLRQLYADAGVPEDELNQIFKRTDEGNYIFEDGSHHVIKMFYLERGHTASNLGIKFNLATFLASQLSKVDQDGNPIRDASFALYNARKGNDGEYVILNEQDPLYTGTTLADGKFTLVHGKYTADGEPNPKEGLPISFADLEGEYFVLRETGIPNGYRSAGDMNLKKHVFGDGAVTLVSDPDSPQGSKWNTGSYASARQLTSVNSRDIYLRETDDAGNRICIMKDSEFQTVDGVDYEQGTMFAVITRWIGDEPIDASTTEAELNDHRNWAPVYGNAQDGYHMVIPEAQTEAAYAKALSIALQNTTLSDSRKFYLSDSGYYQVEIINMPGDILHYLHANQADDISKVQYNIFYGWTNEEELANVTESSTFKRLDSDRFTRSFSATFNVVNTIDKLTVRKVDVLGNRMEGVAFELEPVKKEGDQYVTETGGRATLAGTTTAAGEYTFQSLQQGWYLLKETGLPAKYADHELSDPVPVFVQTTGRLSGVYAYAGTKDDGVRVERGVGALVGTMHEFGSNDDLDRTLHNIIITPQLWDGTWQNVGPEVHLHHAHNDAGNQPVHAFVPMDSTDNTPYVHAFDEGWPHLLIQQCPEALDDDEHHPDNSTAYWEELGNRNITNLFTREVTVEITNYPKHATVVLEGEKNLLGREAEKGEFRFTLQAVTQDAPMPVENVVTNGADGSFQFGQIRLTYDMADKTYIYRIDEEKGTDSSIAYDDSYWIATVKVKTEGERPELTSYRVTAAVTYSHYDANGNLIPEESADQPTFTNRWHSPDVPVAGVYLEGDKELQGRDMAAGEFSFRLQAVTPGAPMPAETVVTNGLDGSFRFGQIGFAYDQTNKTYTYRLDEVKGTDSSITYDDSYWIVTVKVETEGDSPAVLRYLPTVAYSHYDANGNLIPGENANQPTFTNQWHAPTGPVAGMLLGGEKELLGRNMVAGEFSFRLQAVTPGAPMPAETVVTNGLDGSFRFGQIGFAYDQTNKTYTYRLEEIKGTDSNITYDDSYWIVTMKVEKVDEQSVSVGYRITVDYGHYDVNGNLISNGTADWPTFTNQWHSPNVPVTGDSAHPLLWMAGMLIAGAAMLLLAVRRKHHA